MDIRKYCKRTASRTDSTDVATESECNSHEDDDTPGSSKRACTESNRKYNKKWEKSFQWLHYDEDIDGAFCSVRQKWAHPSSTTKGSGGVWVDKPFTNWKKAIEKMKSHNASKLHLDSCQAALLSNQAKAHGTVAQQLQQIDEGQRKKNREALKALVRCAHYLARHHIAHTTNYDDLVGLMVSCGAQPLSDFVEDAVDNATYRSAFAVIGFIEAISVWVEEGLLSRLHQAPYYTLMADECTDVSTLEEMSIFCRWVENGLPVEHFIDIVPLKSTDAETIYTALVDCLKQKSIKLASMVGMGFDGAAPFSGKHTGVQARLKQHAPYAVYVHCHGHRLQLACIQAANATKGIDHVYTTLTTLWKVFHNSPKCAQSLKEVQSVLNLPELKVVKPSDTLALSREMC